MMNEKQKENQKKVGHNRKANPSTHRYVFRLTDEENAKFLTLFEASRADNKAHFITSILFEKPIKSVSIDMGTVDYYTKLSALFAQFRAIGVNYNQVVKILYRNFSEKKAAAYLFKLEKQTIELVKTCQDIKELTKDFEGKYLNKSSLR